MARRPVPRHGRKLKRFTPRRWLPFLAMCAIVALGVVVASRDTTTGRSPTEAPAASKALVPAVAPKGALSSAWFCGGGSALGANGPAEMTLLIANDDGRGAVADITVYDDADGHRSVQVLVPANGRTRVAVPTIRTGTWVAATVELRGGRTVVEREVRGPLGFDAAPCATAAAQEWFVPSGSTKRGSEEYLSLFNPFPDSSSVDISFATETGRRAPRALQSFSVPGRSLRMVRVADTTTDRAQVAATVRTRSGRIVVDRIQIHDGTGDPVKGVGPDAPTTDAPIGLVSTVASSGSAPRWFFPGSSLADGTRSRLAVFNPSSGSVRVDVVISYQDPKSNGVPEPIQITVPARQTEIVDLTDQSGLLVGVPFTVDVRSLDGVSVVAERTVDTGRPAKRRGATITAGSPVAARRWLVAQGGPSRARSSSVTVANPGPNAVHLRVVQLTSGTRRPLAGGTITIPAGDRRQVPVADAGVAATLEINADGPVVVAYGLSQTDGLGLASALAEPFPESVVALPPTG